MDLYQKFFDQFAAQFHLLRKKYRIVGTVRLVVVLAIIYLFYKFLSTEQSSYLWVVLGLVVFFIILMRIHMSMSWKMRYHQALMELNEEEIGFLRDKKKPFDDGKEFLQQQHPYAYDLDIFGAQSLFQFLNRTASYVGKFQLAGLLNQVLTPKEILENQEAVKELSTQIEWRQNISALSKMAPIHANEYEKIKHWASNSAETLSTVRLIASFAVPALLLIAILGTWLLEHTFWGYLVSLLFTANLILATSKTRDIQKEIVGADKIHETIQNYSLIIRKIEKSEFKGAKLQRFVALFTEGERSVSQELKELSAYFEKINTIANVFVMVVFNGFFQYHIHVLNGLLKWKKQHAPAVPKWLDAIGELEALNALANYSYNNRGYCFPVLNTEGKMNFKDLGHPLIDASKRVSNDIDFTNQRFVILTGSNMSGKSTFLRTVGVNLILAGIGAPICSSKASFFPMPLFVSMRLEDSLSDSESYFYAEVKRLKLIVESVKEEPCFVLLDEILRGTNSDDKQSGTIGVILKLIQDQTFGMIATHDLEVCEITKDHPTILTNKCFEVEMHDDELFFDYKIYDGICKNKNATFIMKKMGII
ncbi:DNA mismatch repair protein MutS [Flavobacterium sp. HSC-61S13]|uniref:MutS-related protein n=1 Tax=Flavobacterium sp. HSC-61S13 TaxID=2910963 RepID=UPI00209FFEAD|nr:DNA mismatch repair protein MutS [Flavobacterium sp. HSC-61S13]MCP1995548.1 DNA mismatch repair ATPase MutS [Flavobacterium sp. HSC-61S13]